MRRHHCICIQEVPPSISPQQFMELPVDVQLQLIYKSGGKNVYQTLARWERVSSSWEEIVSLFGRNIESGAFLASRIVREAQSGESPLVPVHLNMSFREAHSRMLSGGWKLGFGTQYIKDDNDLIAFLGDQDGKIETISIHNPETRSKLLSSISKSDLPHRYTVDTVQTFSGLQSTYSYPIRLGGSLKFIFDDRTGHLELIQLVLTADD